MADKAVFVILGSGESVLCVNTNRVSTAIPVKRSGDCTEVFVDGRRYTVNEPFESVAEKLGSESQMSLQQREAIGKAYMPH